MKRHPSHQLDVIVTFPDHSSRSFTDQGKGFWKQVILDGAFLDSFPELFRAAWKILILERFHFTLEGIDLHNLFTISLKDLFVFVAKQFSDRFQHEVVRRIVMRLWALFRREKPFQQRLNQAP